MGFRCVLGTDRREVNIDIPKEGSRCAKVGTYFLHQTELFNSFTPEVRKSKWRAVSGPFRGPWLDLFASADIIICGVHDVCTVLTWEASTGAPRSEADASPIKRERRSLNWTSFCMPPPVHRPRRLQQRHPTNNVSPTHSRDPRSCTCSPPDGGNPVIPAYQ